MDHEAVFPVSEFGRLCRVLHDDVEHAWQAVDSHDDQYARRSLVRSALTAVDAVVFALKQDCLRECKIGLYTAGELAMIREETYSIDNRGEVYSQVKYPTLEQNVRFTFRMLNRGVSEFQLDCGGEGWEGFKKAIKVRHRVTHPKCADDLDVTDDELICVWEAFGWFMLSVVEFQAHMLNELEHQINEFKKRHNGVLKDNDTTTRRPQEQDSDLEARVSADADTRDRD